MVGDGGPKDAKVDALPTPDAAPLDAALACTAPVELDASVDEPTFECCLGVVEEMTGDAGFTVVDAGAVAADPSVDNCCKAIIAHVDTTTADYSKASPTLPTCCGANDYPMGTACTPWGPPMPPELALAEVA